VQGAQQRLVDRLRFRSRLRQPATQGLQVAADFCFENFEQDAVHRRRRAFGNGRLGHGLGQGRFGRCGNRNIHLTCLHRDFRGRLRDGRQIRLPGLHIGVLTGGDALGHGFQTAQVGTDRRLPAQGGIDLRQHGDGLIDHRHHRQAGRTGAVEHAVEHALDLPAELAQVFAPTSRPLPLSVWNTRRTGLSASMLSGAAFQTGSKRSRLTISSSNSSRNTSRMSLSMPSTSSSKPPSATVTAGDDDAIG
jgi:hypothetical protein